MYQAVELYPIPWVRQSQPQEIAVSRRKNHKNSSKELLKNDFPPFFLSRQATASHNDKGWLRPTI